MNNHPNLQIRVVILFLAFITFFQENATAQPQTVKLFDDFSAAPFNSLDEETAAFADTIGSSITKVTIQDYDAFCHTGESLRLIYELSADSSGLCGMVSVFPADLDLSVYNYFSFWVKSNSGGGLVQIELEQNDSVSSKISINNYLPCGITQEWQKVVIPLDAFWNITDWTNLRQMAILFESRSTYYNGSPFSGEVYFDDFLFGTFHPGFVKIDPFSDKYPVNATGANNGVFAETQGSENYSSQLICASSTSGSCDCKLKLNFNNGGEDFFGGFFAILGGDTSGWMGISKDIFPDYDSLYFKAYALNSFTNPRLIKVELKKDSVNKLEKYVLGIGLDEKAFSVAFSDFDVMGDPDSIREFVIVFEKNYQPVPSGSLIIDDIELRAEGYQFPDLSAPPPPQDLRVDGSSPSGIINLSGNVTVSAEIQNNDQRLESIRLEYYRGCDWYCLEKKYAPFHSSLQSFTVSSNAFPAGLPLKMRVVAENYNGRSTPSEEFLATVEGEGAISPEELFRNSYTVFEFLRTETGVYRDAINLNGEQFHPASVATTGMGLIALCIADANGWITNAWELALETLKSVNGLRPGFRPERNCAGWFRHFIDINTGAQAWDSEFSSIDSGILTAGALFCKRYFSNNDSIALLADALYLSTDWESMLADPNTGGIYLISDCAGNGQYITLPYNEYMLVAWLAKNDFRNDDMANSLWENKYANPGDLQTSSFMGIDVLTDFPGNFLSGFVHQFTHYLCNYYTSHPDYQQYFENAMRADSLWWRENTETHCYVWGFGAGAACEWSPGFYHADDIVAHPGTICSPHIIAGFIPANPNGLNGLLNLQATPLGVYRLPDINQTPVLWRFSVEDPAWLACDLQGIDFSTMLLGLAAHPDMLGNAFFSENNDFNYPSENTVAYPPAIEMPDMLFIEGNQLRLSVWDIAPGVAPSMLEWDFQGYDPNLIEITVDDCRCEIVFHALTNDSGAEHTIEYTITFPEGETVSGIINLMVNTFEEIADENSPLFLGQNYPNPFKNGTIIPFRIKNRGQAWLKIFDAGGKEVYRQALGELLPGNHETAWNGRSQDGSTLPAGTYFYSIQVDGLTKVRKMSTYR